MKNFFKVLIFAAIVTAGSFYFRGKAVSAATYSCGSRVTCCYTCAQGMCDYLVPCTGTNSTGDPNDCGPNPKCIRGDDECGGGCNVTCTSGCGGGNPTPTPGGGGGGGGGGPTATPVDRKSVV